MNKQGYHRRSFVHLYMTASAVCKLSENWTKSENILTWSDKKKLIIVNTSEKKNIHVHINNIMYDIYFYLMFRAEMLP